MSRRTARAPTPGWAASSSAAWARCHLRFELREHGVQLLLGAAEPLDGVLGRGQDRPGAGEPPLHLEHGALERGAQDAHGTAVERLVADVVAAREEVAKDLCRVLERHGVRIFLPGPRVAKR